MRFPQALITCIAASLAFAAPQNASANSLMTEACQAYADDVKRLTEDNKKFSEGNYVRAIWDVKEAPINPNTPTTGKEIVAACTSRALWKYGGQSFIDFNLEESDEEGVVTIMYYPHQGN